MKTTTFFKATTLIILAGIVFYLASPKYEVSRFGEFNNPIRLNKITGAAFLISSDDKGKTHWDKIKE